MHRQTNILGFLSLQLQTTKLHRLILGLSTRLWNGDIFITGRSSLKIVQPATCSVPYLTPEYFILVVFMAPLSIPCTSYYIISSPYSTDTPSDGVDFFRDLCHMNQIIFQDETLYCFLEMLHNMDRGYYM